MAGETDQPAKTLFNNPTLSDVKIKQIKDGKTREYFAHKAVLCGQSSYFMNAFTGAFKEATEDVMELHDDNADHFEVALTFIYTLSYTPVAFWTQLSDSDKVNNMQFAMGVHKVADKYDIKRLIQPVMDDFQATLNHTSQTSALESIIETHYASNPSRQHLFGTLLASTLFRMHHAFTCSGEYKELCRQFPVFASDILESFQHLKCDNINCGKTNIVTAAAIGTTARCSYCEYGDLSII